MKTHKFFNTSTRQAMFEKVKGYVDKSLDLGAEIARIQRDHGLERVYRFDLGENAEGYSPRIVDYLDGLRDGGKIKPERLIQWLSAYPDRNYTPLKQRLAETYGIPADWILIGAGADSLIDLITRVLLEPRDVYVMPVPSFFLFEEFSERMGAIPFFLELKEEDEFRWTEQTTQNFKRLVDTFRPKIVWIANPNNPTGQFLPLDLLHELIDYASGYNAFVVIDEAYGEYTDPPGGVHSAARFLSSYENLLVVRTFSKKYGLAALRIGYVMSASEDIRDGLRIHLQPFPAAQAAADLALIALEDHAFLEQSRAHILASQHAVTERLSRLPTLRMMPTQTSIFMLKSRRLSAAEFALALETRGIIAARLDISGIKHLGYLRFTLRSSDDNGYLCSACEEIDRESA